MFKSIESQWFVIKKSGKHWKPTIFHINTCEHIFVVRDFSWFHISQACCFIFATRQKDEANVQGNCCAINNLHVFKLGMEMWWSIISINSFQQTLWFSYWFHYISIYVAKTLLKFMFLGQWCAHGWPQTW